MQLHNLHAVSFFVWAAHKNFAVLVFNQVLEMSLSFYVDNIHVLILVFLD